MADLSIDTEPAGCGATCAAHEIWEAVDHLMRLIALDDPASLEHRLGQLGLSTLYNIIAERLTQIDLQFEEGVPTRTPEQFWADYDAGKLK